MFEDEEPETYCCGRCSNDFESCDFDFDWDYCHDCVREARREEESDYNASEPLTYPVHCEACNDRTAITHWNPVTEEAFCESCGSEDVNAQEIPVLAAA